MAHAAPGGHAPCTSPTPGYGALRSAQGAQARRGAPDTAPTAGAQPTNNAAERSVRKVVLWRKTSFRSASRRGARFAERMLIRARLLGEERQSPRSMAT